MERKSVVGWSFKAAEGTRGATAVFARFDRGPDAHGDLYAPGAFTDGEPVIVSPWNHTSMSFVPPVGKGTIRAYADRAEATVEFFDTAAGIEAHRTLRELGALAEWSYGFDILDSEPTTWNDSRARLLKRLHVFEVSPVWQGAGRDTGTLDVTGPKDVDAEREYLRFVRQRWETPAQRERAELRAIRARVLR